MPTERQGRNGPRMKQKPGNSRRRTGPAKQTTRTRSRNSELSRQSPSTDKAQLRIADLEIDTFRHRAARATVPLDLTPKEFLLLKLLVHSAGEVISRKTILEQVWNLKFDPGTNVVDSMVRRLRTKVDRSFEPKLIHTVRRTGYVCKLRGFDSVKFLTQHYPPVPSKVLLEKKSVDQLNQAIAARRLDEGLDKIRERAAPIARNS